MIRITATMDGKADLTKFVHNLKTNIRRSQTRLAHDVTSVAWHRAKANAPVWRGELKNSIYAKFFKKKGEVFVSEDWLIQAKARANEFGVTPHYVDRDEYPEIDAWASEKGYVHRTKPNKVFVGGRGTRLGKPKPQGNQFFQPSFIETQKQIPMIMAKVIARVMKHTRG